MMNNTEPRLSPAQRRAVVWTQYHRGQITLADFQFAMLLIKLDEVKAR
jgi:hypothetical protein